MRVSKNQVTVLGAAIAALFAVGANAQIVLPSSNPTVAAVNGNLYAAELNAGTQLSPAGITVNTISGIGLSNGQDRYIKITLSGANFNSAAIAANLTVASGTAPNVQVAFGGQLGTNSVIYQVTAQGAAGILINDSVQFNMTTGVNVTSTASSATVSYEVFEFLAQAQAGSPVLYARTGSVAGFQRAVVLSSPAAQNSTATAASSFRNVNTGVAAAAETATRARIAQLTLALPAVANLTAGFTNCTNAPCLANNTAATVGTIVNGASTNNTFALAGDFGAAASAASINTANANENASAVTATTATLPLLANTIGATGFTNLNIRYTVNGTTALPVSSYTASLTPVANAGYTIGTLGPLTTGNINRDGVQLDSPWVTVTPGFISRFFITQSTPADVPYTVTVRNAAGLVTGGTLTGTLGPNRQSQITLASLLPADTTAFPGPYQVTFNINATASVTQAAYVLTAPNGSVAIQNLYTLAAQ
jgi:hypothetical protein